MALKEVRKRLPTLGGIGLEMGTVYSTLGARLNAVDITVAKSEHRRVEELAVFCERLREPSANA